MDINWDNLKALATNPGALRGVVYLLMAAGVKIDPAALADILMLGTAIIGAIHISVGSKEVANKPKAKKKK